MRFTSAAVATLVVLPSAGFPISGAVAAARADVIAGGPAPLIATALFAAYQTGYAIAIYIAACAVVSLVAVAFMPDYTGKDISMEYDD